MDSCSTDEWLDRRMAGDRAEVVPRPILAVEARCAAVLVDDEAAREGRCPRPPAWS
jgi:hypothetical protein